ncbi:MAG: tetratricopeptide repeat protein, partial [Muribaculaceae bacterium]|nr:tetratricopeptide repeat protein [Muribaculaceae bacterium]
LSSIKTDPLITSDTPTGRNDETSNAIDSFLDPRIEKETEKEMPEKREETPILSESLARAMIKNGNYVKALEIITDLSLNNPKKSIYFADQIRFLKKLILNQSKQNKP